MRVMIDRHQIVESRPELRTEIDEALMQLAETLAVAHFRSFNNKVGKGKSAFEAAAMHKLWSSLDPGVQQARCLGIAAIRILELVRERDPEQFEALAMNTMKIFMSYMEDKEPEVPRTVAKGVH